MEIPSLMPHQMEPFNGDTFIELEFLKLKERFKIDTAVETGTCFGSTTKFLAKHFKKVISIEINHDYLEIATSLMGPIDNVHTYLGASEKILAEILNSGARINNNTIFFLDAHWETHCPLQSELFIIGEHKIKPVIAIHDFYVPDQPGLAFDTYAGQPFTFEWLKPLFDEIYGEDGYEYYYNNEENSTAIKKGIIYITPKRNPMINLFVNFYNDKHQTRQEEINECISRNIKNPMIDRIYFVTDTCDINFYGFDKSEKVEKVIHNERPTFNYLFELAISKIRGDDISIFSNVDIYFDEDCVCLIRQHLVSSVCFALSRWERWKDNSITLFDRPDSQDSWIFKGPISDIPNCNFTMGTPGCDNAISQRIEDAGYTVQNPGRDIKTIHIHNCGIRNYQLAKVSETATQPFKYIPPANLDYTPVNWVTEIANLPVSGQQSQFYEEVIIDHIFKNIGTTNLFMVDLGAGAYGDSTMSNTRKLKQAGWNGYGIDARNKGEDWIIERFISPGNILNIMAEQNTPKDFDFLNLDIDSCDFWVLKNILKEYAPRCICTEYNGTLDPAIPAILRYEDGYTWDETNKYGYSFAAGIKLLEEYGYSAIYNMGNQNIFAVKKDLVKGLIFNVTANRVQYHPESSNAIWETY